MLLVYESCEDVACAQISSLLLSLSSRYPRLQSSNPIDRASIGEVAAETELYRGFVQSGLGKEELMLRVGISVEANDDLGPSDRVTYAVVKGVAEFL